MATTAIPPKPVKSSKEGVAKAETSVNSQSGQPSSKDSITSEAKPSQSSQQSIKTESKGPTKQPAAKRGKTDIFKAFAKPKPRLESQDTASSVDSAPPVLSYPSGRIPYHAKLTVTTARTYNCST